MQSLQHMKYFDDTLKSAACLRQGLKNKRSVEYTEIMNLGQQDALWAGNLIINSDQAFYNNYVSSQKIQCCTVLSLLKSVFNRHW